MTDHPPAWLGEPYPFDHTITWREHYARKEERQAWEDRMHEQNGPRHE